ncbi:MAG: cupin domain-containing protein [Deltaproteobacteria bacterium]|nr:cupin domain-containing protein [Deltaproteobacteria bacterium]
MKKISIYVDGKFKSQNFNSLLVHDSPYFKIINFNFEPGQELPIHAHNIDGQVSILVLEGEGVFLGEDASLPAKQGDIFICDIAEPHGIKAKSHLRVIVTIAPPI